MNIKFRGFTLIELMIVVVIISILAAIALPSYRAYSRKSAESRVTQEMLKISELLERHKAKNFTYQCFDLSDYYTGASGLTQLAVPLASTGDATQFTLRVVDNSENTEQSLICANGKSSTGSAQSWAIIATKNATNGLVKDDSYNFLLTSSGLKCKNKAGANVTSLSCGTGAENW